MLRGGARGKGLAHLVETSGGGEASGEYTSPLVPPWELFSFDANQGGISRSKSISALFEKGTFRVEFGFQLDP